MEPGTELDALIGTRVMGWTRQNKNTLITHDGSVKVLQYGNPVLFFNPSTDIATAWEVWEKTCDPNRSSIVPIGNGNTGLHYAIAYDNECYVFGKTAPEVICKAALMDVFAGEWR
jgi:hypothetical protein